MNSEFEKYAKDLLSQHEVSVDTNALWAAVGPAVQPAKDRRRFLWLFLSGLLVLSIGILAFINVDKSTSSGQLANSMTLTQHDDTNGTLKEATPAANDPLPTPSSEVIENITLNKAEENNQQSELIQNKLPLPQNQSVNNETLKNKTAANYTQPVSTAANLNTNTNDPIPDPSSAQVTTPADKIVDTNAKNIKLKQTTDDVQDFWRSPVQAISTLAGAVALDQRFAMDPAIIDDIRERRTDDVEEAQGANKGKRSSSYRGGIFNDLRFGIGAYGGISRSTTELEPRGGQNTAYELLRINSEKQLETLHAGLSALVYTEQNFYLRSGLEYTRIGSLFSQNSTRVEIDSVEGIVEILINEITGEVDSISGFLQRTRTISYVKKSYNYFHLVDVPIILGYNFGNEDITIGVEAGIYANLLVARKGEVLQEDETFYDKGEDPRNWYKSNIGVSPFVGANITYHVDDNLKFHLSPGFRLPAVFSTSANPLRESHANLGITAGIRYVFD